MDTLVLDNSYMPLGCVTWKRAMTLWVAGRVEVVDSYEDKEVRTPSTSYKVPSIIRFIGRVYKRWQKKTKFSKKNLYIRDQGRCQYCSTTLTQHKATYDHVQPRSKGGITSWKNVVIACHACNQKKADKTPEQAGMRLLKKPKVPTFLQQVHYTPNSDSYPESWDTFIFTNNK